MFHFFFVARLIIYQMSIYICVFEREHFNQISLHLLIFHIHIERI